MTHRLTRLESLTGLVEIKHGFAFPSTFFGSVGDYILLTPGNFCATGGYRDLGTAQKRYFGPIPANFILKKGDVLIAMTEQAPGLLGSTIKVPRSGVYLHNQRLGLLIIHEPRRVCAEYLYHAFNAPHVRDAISSEAGGTKVKHTSPTKLSGVEVFLPAIEEQQRVAGLLDAWDSAIDKSEQLIASKQQRYKELSGQLLFGLMRFKQNGVSTPKSLHWFSISSEWPVVPIGEIAREVSAVNKTNDELPVLSCTKYDGLVDSLQYFKKQVFSHDLSNYKLVRRGQFAYATNHIEEGSIGYQDVAPAGLVSPIYTVFETDTDRVDDAYLYKLIKTERLRQLFAASTNASVDRRGSLRWSEFARIHIPLPPLEEQREINHVLSTSKREIELLQAEVVAWRSQKRGLMQKLLTGQWRLPLPEQQAV